MFCESDSFLNKLSVCRVKKGSYRGGVMMHALTAARSACDKNSTERLWRGVSDRQLSIEAT